MNVLSIVCCTAVFSFISFNILFPIERIFALPLYSIKSYFKKESIPVQVKPAKKYTMVLVGDSMTQYLGSGTELEKYLKVYYPSKDFSILNYGIGSTTILTVPDRLTSGSVRGSETLMPILSKDFDLILLESFGNNPLSAHADGLKKQFETLDQIVKTIRSSKPKAVIVFVATIAPNKERYAEGIVNLTTNERKIWAEERIGYIKNHIKYAKEHNIPIINIYEKSLTLSGDGNPDYIDSHDFIHPSPTGILFISREIAQFIFQKRIFPL